MNKIGLIISKEYRTRVAKKSFILLTILMPILFVGIIFVPVWLASFDSKEIQNITIIDQTHLYESLFQDNEKFDYLVVNETLEKAKENEDMSAFVVISDDLTRKPDAITIYSNTQVKKDLKDEIENLLEPYVREAKLETYNIPNIQEIIDDSKINLKIATVKWTEDGESQNSSTEIATIIGIVATMLIYMFIFISGSQVMSSVMQEKKNRIIEVMIGSVKPFQLMMGKIISVALVCLTQLAMWGILSGILLTAVSSFANIDLVATQEMSNSLSTSGMMAQSSNMDLSQAQEMVNMLFAVNWFKIIGFFIVFFILGYFLYASLFAAIGSAIDDESDANQFMLPITLLILFALYAGMYSASNPDGPLAFWCSIIPLSSPIVMMVRLPFDVPVWQLALSLSLLALTALGAVWMSAKIYRTGILLYGKKITWKELIKWLTYKN